MTVNNRTVRVLGIIVVILVAVYAITWISAARRTGKHLEDLAGQEPDKVMDALAALRERGPSVGPRLAALVSAGQAESASRAAWLLGMIGTHAGDTALIQAVQSSKEPVVRIAAMQALGQLRVPAAEPVLSGVLSNKEEKNEMRIAAAYGLGELGLPASVTVLTAALNERPQPVPPTPPAPVAPAAAPAPAAAGAEPAAPAAAPPAPAPEPAPDTTIPVRIAAARALGRLGQSGAVNALAAAVSDVEPDAEVRVAAAYALGDVAAAAEDLETVRSAVRGLLAGVEDENGDVRVACVYALGKSSPPEDIRQEVALVVNKAKDDPGYWTRQAAAQSALLLRLPE
jgi:HEAT repeat protein